MRRDSNKYAHSRYLHAWPFWLNYHETTVVIFDSKRKPLLRISRGFPMYMNIVLIKHTEASAWGRINTFLITFEIRSHDQLVTRDRITAIITACWERRNAIYSSQNNHYYFCCKAWLTYTTTTNLRPSKDGKVNSFDMYPPIRESESGQPIFTEGIGSTVQNWPKERHYKINFSCTSAD